AVAAAEGHAPGQRTGSATGAGHLTGADATQTALPSPSRQQSRPSNAVPDKLMLPAVGGTKAPGAATVRHPAVTSGPGAPGFDAATSTERVDQRTATTRTFHNQDGTNTVRLYSGQANVRRADGTWTPVDLSLATGTSGLAPKNAPHAESFGTAAN